MMMLESVGSGEMVREGEGSIYAFHFAVTLHHVSFAFFALKKIFLTSHPSNSNRLCNRWSSSVVLTS